MSDELEPPTEEQAFGWLAMLLLSVGITPTVISHDDELGAYEVLDEHGCTFHVRPLLMVERVA